MCFDICGSIEGLHRAPTACTNATTSKICLLCDKQVNASALGRFRIYFTCSFKVFPNCPRRIATRVILRKIKLSTVFFHLFVCLSQNICISCEQDNVPPPGYWAPEGGWGGGLQGFGVYGKVVNITVHHQYRLLFLRCAYY